MVIQDIRIKHTSNVGVVIFYIYIKQLVSEHTEEIWVVILDVNYLAFEHTSNTRVVGQYVSL